MASNRANPALIRKSYRSRLRGFPGSPDTSKTVTFFLPCNRSFCSPSIQSFPRLYICRIYSHFRTIPLYIVDIKREALSPRNNKFFPTFTLRSQRLGNPLFHHSSHISHSPQTPTSPSPSLRS